MKIHLRASNGRYVSFHAADEDSPVTVDREEVDASVEFELILSDYAHVSTGDTGWLRTGQYISSGAGYSHFRGDLYVTTRRFSGELGGLTNQLFANTRLFGAPDSSFELYRQNNSGYAIEHGDRIGLRFLQAERPGWLSIETGNLMIVDKEDPEDTELFVVETMAVLQLYRHPVSRDNFSTCTPPGKRSAINAGYEWVRAQGLVFMNDGHNRKPLFLFWNSGREDNYTAAGGYNQVSELESEADRDAAAEGYNKARLEGYILDQPETGSIPLRTYFKGPLENEYRATTTIEGERQAADEGYIFVREEGYLFPLVVESLWSSLLYIPGAGLLPVDGHEHGTGEEHGPTIGEGIDPPEHGQRPDPGHGIGVPITRPRRRRASEKTALVLSGGGAKGSFQVGAIKHLWSQGYRPDIIVGVSVGALNGAKLAECLDSSAADLEAIWRELEASPAPGRAVFLKELYLNLGKKWGENLLVDAIDDAVGAFSLDPFILRGLYLAAHLHSVHSMYPLQNLIKDHLDLGAIRDAGTELRLGMTDMGTGQFFSVSEPFPESAPAGLAFCGRIELEPDHERGQTWLSRPIFGADSYAMSIEDALYASLVQPVFMDPKVLNLRDATPLTYEGERISMLFRARTDLTGGYSTYMPPALRRILMLTGFGEAEVSGGELAVGLNRFLDDALPFDFEQFDREGFDRIMGDSRSAHKHLYDGGLRDTTPIRTAMRLGARDILVITGDRLQAVNWRYKSPGALDPAGDLDIAAIPLAQYFLGLLNMWNNDVARTDKLLALAQNEFIGWLYRCFSMIEGDKRSELIEQFNEYWQVHGRRLFRELGGSTWLGGRQGFFTSRDHGITPAEAAARVYGVPFHDEGCRIRYIAPEREIVDARAFDDFTGIEEAMLLGERAADHPVELSYPVPDDLIGEH